jgi:NADH-quinone oxidoreductase subunit H
MAFLITGFLNIFAFFWVLLHAPLAKIIGISLIKIICILIAVAYFTIAERKIMAAIQRRKGPNVVGFWGLLQPLADGAKLLVKELLIPTRANKTIFLLAPLMVLILSIVSWSVIPFDTFPSVYLSQNDYLFEYNPFDMVNSSLKKFLWSLYYVLLGKIVCFNQALSNSWSLASANITYSILFILAISGLNVYGIIIAGWASNSKYAFLGSLRSSAQMISYEVSLSLLILPVILLAGSLNFTHIVTVQQKTGWFIFPLLPCGILFFISMLAETNRAPFDLPEAEAELVAGYNVEYSSIIFAMFFLGEYSNMLLMSTVIVLLFFGGWLAPFYFLTFLPATFYFSLKIVIFCFIYILVRAALPRFRYDQLMDLGWKTFLPFALSFFVFTVGILVISNGLPFLAHFSHALGYIYTENFFLQS